MARNWGCFTLVDGEANAALAGQVALAILGNGYLTNQVISLDGGLYPR